MEISLAFVGSAFLAGIITFLAPCTLPLVPAYLGFISGVDTSALNDPKRAAEARRSIAINGILFVIGFSIIFILFGTLTGLLGQALTPWRIWLTRIGGMLVIFFGIYMLDIIKLPFLSGEYRARLPKWLTPGNPSTALIAGSAFAFGWSPCTGPVLAAVLVLSGSSGTAFTGAMLLTIFSLGLAIPFLIVSFAFSHATRYIKRIQPLLSWVSRIAGVILIGVGILLLTNNFTLLIEWGFDLFKIINYEGIEQYL